MNCINENVKVIDTKESKSLNELIVINYLNKLENPFMILSVKDVSKDLRIGINQAYDLFKQNEILFTSSIMEFHYVNL